MKPASDFGKPAKILAIAIDGAESSLIEKWMNEGYLKNLASLRSKGSFGKLSSTADWLACSVWPTFYTSSNPGKHGFYNFLQWKSNKMEYDRPGPDWINAIPFWRQLGDDCKVIAIDMPLTFPPEQFNGMEICGWASHDGIFPASAFPADKLEWVIENFGEPPITSEMNGLQSLKDLFEIKEELIAANKKETDLVINLINTEKWDLCLCCFSSTHRAGHKFWDISNVKDSPNEEQKLIFKTWLRDVYESCDRAIGKIINSVKDDVTILVFSLHGMGTNTSLSEYLLPKMISNIINEGRVSNKKDNTIKKIRRKIPIEWRTSFKKLLPIQMQDKMTAYWRIGGTDWEKTKVFNLLSDLHGYIRINLKGREEKGIVEEGAEYEQLCEKLINGLKTFRDGKTNEEVIESIDRSMNLFCKGDGFNNLPDIIVKWKIKPAAGYTRIISSEYGELKLPFPGKNTDGRSGNHRPDGFLMAVGPNFKMNSSFENKYHIIDLAPTILNLLNIEIPKEMEGNVID